MPWLSLLKPLAALLERLATLALLWRAAKGGRDEERLRQSQEALRRAGLAARARDGVHRDLERDARRLREDDGFRRD